MLKYNIIILKVALKTVILSVKVFYAYFPQPNLIEIILINIGDYNMRTNEGTRSPV
jgi:hypothetical protein